MNKCYKTIWFKNKINRKYEANNWCHNSRNVYNDMEAKTLSKEVIMTHVILLKTFSKICAWGNYSLAMHWHKVLIKTANLTKIVKIRKGKKKANVISERSWRKRQILQDPFGWYKSDFYTESFREVSYEASWLHVILK